MRAGPGAGLACLAAGVLLACGPEPPLPPAATPPAPPVPPAQEPDDRALGAAIRAALDHEPGDARYFDAAIDLDGDGRPERVVYVAGPVTCGTGGCTALVFAQGHEGYRLVTRITVARTPIWASSRRTQGWRNLLVSIGGGGGAAGIAELRFDGAGYPSNPTWPPPDRVADIEGAQMLIPAFESYRDGKPIVTGASDAFVPSRRSA